MGKCFDSRLNCFFVFFSSALCLLTTGGQKNTARQNPASPHRPQQPANSIMLMKGTIVFLIIWKSQFFENIGESERRTKHNFISPEKQNETKQKKKHPDKSQKRERRAVRQSAQTGSEVHSAESLAEPLSFVSVMIHSCGLPDGTESAGLYRLVSCWTISHILIQVHEWPCRAEWCLMRGWVTPTVILA